MSSNLNLKESADVSSQNIYNVANESSNYLLDSTSEKSKNSSNHLNVKNTKGSSSRRGSIHSITDNPYTSEPEFIDIKTDKPSEPENHVDFKKFSPSSSPVTDRSSYFQSEAYSRSNGGQIKNFYNDICIPLEKINGSDNLEDFYKINYEKFQHYCDKPGKVKSMAFKNTELDNIRRRKPSVRTNSLDSYISVTSSTNNEKSSHLRKRKSNYRGNSLNSLENSSTHNNNNNNNNSIKNNSLLSSAIQEISKIDSTRERISFYCKDDKNKCHIQRINTFQQLRPVENVPISETMKKKFFWIDVLKPTKEEIAVLSDVFGIHPLTVEDMEYDDTREKIETFINYYYININSFEENSSSFEILPINVSVLVFKNFVLSFHNKPIQHTDHILTRMAQLSAYDFEFNGDWIAYAHIDDISDSFYPYINSAEIDVNTIDELVLILKESEKNDMLRRIGEARKRVTALLRLVTDKSEIIKNLIKRINTLTPNSNNLLYLSDVQDHVITMVQNLHHFEETLIRAHSNYLAQINIEITLATNDTNDIANKLSVLGTVFLPLSLISGMWGMNVLVPGQVYMDSLIPFFIICLAMVVITVISIIISKRLGMI
jgi:magnesium transporter